MRTVLFVCLIALVSLSLNRRSQAEDLGVPFERLTIEDSLNRSITAYLSKAPKESAGQKLPVILVISGSGSQSIFMKTEKGISSGLQGLALMVAKGRCRVLAVEKPGVAFLDNPKQPGSAMEGTQEFLREHTLERWAVANASALKSVLSRSDIDSSRVLVLGHSEGGIVAARVAAEVREVTHVAPLSCGGVTQLFSLAQLARERSPESEREQAAQAVFAEWEKILADPDSIEKTWMGHPYRRWSSFLRASVVEELKRGKAKVYLAQGTADQAESVIGFDVMHAELLAAGRQVVAERIEGGDHGLGVGGKMGLPKVFENVVQWFLN